jgi:hypothetical protein
VADDILITLKCLELEKNRIEECGYKLGCRNLELSNNMTKNKYD